MQVTVNGIDTHYVFDDRSGGSALAFIHQLGGDLSVWDTLAGHFRHRHSVLRYDVRGHGASAVASEPFGFAQLAADLAALFDATGIEQAHLVGMSMGGMIAQQFALDYPDRVITLTLCDTASHTPPEARATWNERAATVRRDGLAALADATMARWFTEDFRHAHAQTVQQICDVLLRTPSEGYAMACEALRDFDAAARLAQLRVPTLAVAGRFDNGTPATLTQALARAIEGSHFVVLDAAHLAPVEESHRFTALLETFLKQLV
ncbi:3-oxoadipate enol-lactonase [Paraburkholderia unamae]|uniref:3-oxoadipate enol-lactonase n=1 Tax=Paraburkholderia unamae TaxID=219649 RepID=A0ABX5KVR5_9BURK|nr:3-oxoadipate enol-lactonase [Paraburkholderia unamae]PVX97756.1 3-oxoadipate enol-lactonase [Paraburkholderia unamae]CAG9248733.1 Beta-ketoadipate enol-lactone hydrolase [Paraburkholderia unamae]